VIKAASKFVPNEQMLEVCSKRSRAAAPVGPRTPEGSAALRRSSCHVATRPGRPLPAACDAESRNDPLLPAPASLRTLVF